MNRAVKIVVGGSGAIGKTTLCNRINGITNFDDITMTPGIEIHAMECSDKSKACLWDLGGQERFRFVQDSYVYGAKILILLFSVEWVHSIKDLPNWLELIPKSNPPDKIFLVANKIDSPNRVVLKEDIEDLLQQHNMEYFELSAKTGLGVSEFKHRLEQVIGHVRSKKKKPYFMPPNKNLRLQCH